MPMLKPGGKIETMVFMKKLLLTMLGVLIALPTFAQDFSYSYEGQTITYTVISEGKKPAVPKAALIDPVMMFQEILFSPPILKTATQNIRLLLSGMMLLTGAAG